MSYKIAQIKAMEERMEVLEATKDSNEAHGLEYEVLREKARVLEESLTAKDIMKSWTQL